VVAGVTIGGLVLCTAPVLGKIDLAVPS
jgi:hypothetical protein